VRHALHRYFLHKHGWYVKGMQQPARNSSDASSSAGVLKDHVPEYVQGLMQERMESEDWRLHELALCAAAISQLIQEEVMADLRFVYSTVLQFSTTSDLNEYQYGSVVDMYLAQYILDENWHVWRPASMMKEVRGNYDGWGGWGPVSNSKIGNVEVNWRAIFKDILPGKLWSSFINMATSIVRKY